MPDHHTAVEVGNPQLPQSHGDTCSVLTRKLTSNFARLEFNQSEELSYRRVRL